MMAYESYLAKWKPKKWVVVECRFLESGLEYHWIAFKKNKSEFLKIDSGNFKENDSIPDNIKSKPIILWLTGKGVIHQTSSNNWDKRSDIQVFQDAHEPYLSLIKGDVLEQLKDKWCKEKINLIDVFLGASRLSNYRDTNAYVGYYSFNQNIPVWEERKTEQKSLYNKELSSSELGFYVVSLSFLNQNGRVDLVDFNYYRIKNGILRLGLPIVLALLLVNFLVYQPLFKKQQELKAITMQQSFEDWKDAEIAWRQRQTFLSLNEKTTPGKKSWLLDQFILLKPNSLILEQVHVFNPPFKFKSNEKPSWNDAIQINGKTKNGKDLEDWIKKIEALEFVKRCSIDYVRTSKGIHEFSFKTYLNEK